ncbi:MAG: NAD-dependent dehydratase [Elusimicrobia bacterium RIFCSPLOWO2_01_FULL_59_12]|nr:MAG: NAD-dependent dehydratase [Elusimicrobia bacterium RIFCSPLOWO2_01_FULL_59_12]
MNLKSKRVLVTGAGGFIGSHLVERLLKEGARVRALTHYNSRRDYGHLRGLASPALEIVMGDVRDPGSVDQAVQGCEAVFHLAALIAIPYSYQAPTSFIETNVKGTLHVLEACRRHRVKRMVHTSTSETYGTAQYTPMDERHPLQAQSPYAASKAAADLLADSYWRSYGVPVVTIRPFNTFGPRQSLRAVIPSIIAQALHGNGRLRLGRLDPIRDFNFVKDTAEAFILATRSDDAIGQVLNVGSGRGWKVGEVVDRVYALCRKKAPRAVRDPRRMRPDKSEVFELVCDARRARQVLGWRPRVSFDDGLRQSLDFYRQHLKPSGAADFVL